MEAERNPVKPPTSDDFRPAAAYTASISRRVEMGRCVVADSEGPLNFPARLNMDVWRLVVAALYNPQHRMRPNSKRTESKKKNDDDDDDDDDDDSEDESEKAEREALESSKAALFAIARTCRALRFVIERDASWGVFERRQHDLAYRHFGTHYSKEDKEAQQGLSEALAACSAEALSEVIPKLPPLMIFEHESRSAYNVSNRLLAARCLKCYGVPGLEVRLVYLTSIEPWRKRTIDLVKEGIELVKFKDFTGPGQFDDVKLPSVHVDRVLEALDTLMTHGWVDPHIECIVCYACVSMPIVLEKDDMIRLLKELVNVRKIDINLGTLMSGMTPLHRAVRHKLPWLVDWLLDNGADPNKPLIRTHTDDPTEIDWFTYGATPLDVAKALYYRDMSAEASCQILDAFRKKGCDV